MADKFIIRAEATPVVSISDGDGDATDVIHHDVNKILGGDSMIINASEATGQPKWYVALNRQIGATTGPSVVDGNYSDGTVHDDNDHIMGYYIKHLGVDENGDAVTDFLTLNRFATSQPLFNIYPGESAYGRCHNNTMMDVGSFKIWNNNSYNIMVDIVCFCDYTP